MVGSSSSTSSCAFDDERRLSKREGKERRGRERDSRKQVTLVQRRQREPEYTRNKKGLQEHGNTSSTM